jgi:hypothetical protein
MLVKMDKIDFNKTNMLEISHMNMTHLLAITSHNWLLILYGSKKFQHPFWLKFQLKKGMKMTQFVVAMF